MVEPVLWIMQSLTLNYSMNIKMTLGKPLGLTETLKGTLTITYFKQHFD